MRGSKSQSFSFDRQTGIAERRASLSFKSNEGFWQTFISTNAHDLHVSNKITVREEKFGSEDFCSDLETSIQIRLIAVRDTEIAIAIEVFQFMGHREGHRI